MPRVTLSAAPKPAPEAPRDCPVCPRVKSFRDQQKAGHPDWFTGAVPSFGAETGELAVVGLAPGLQGANRTGRPFTGDFAGGLLYETLLAHGFATGKYDARPDDTVRLKSAIITNAVRCVPPENKPTPAEETACRPFLAARLQALPKLKAIVALGHIAHKNVVLALGGRLSATPFGHGAEHDLAGIRLFDSYHCSRYNTNTGRLTPDMFNTIFRAVKAYLGK